MNWIELLASLGGVIVALGGFEALKWLMNRKSNTRIAKAEAHQEEIEAKTDEFHLLRERLELSDKQLLEKEQRFLEQTQLLRDTNKQLLAVTVENGNLQAEISGLKAERAMKLCERRGCGQRQPQSGY